jgi:ribose 5-phosphate isomerase A
VTAVATSLASAALAAHCGIPLMELDSSGVDLAVDGADAIDPDLRLIKGLGGAHVRERIVAAASRRFVIVADETKLRPQLAGVVPVELLVFGWQHTLTLLNQAGGGFSLRVDGTGEPVRTDNGNLLADGTFTRIGDPEGLAASLDAIPGVVGHGLFLGMADLVIVGGFDGRVTRREPAQGRSPHLSSGAPRSGAQEVATMSEETLAWRAIKPGHKVLDLDGNEIGTVHRVLADYGADIFHGVSMRRHLLGPEEQITADRIARITATAIHTTLSRSELGSLPPGGAG